MAAVSLAIVGRDNKVLYCTEFPTKYHWKEEGRALEEDLFGLTLSNDKDEDHVVGENEFDCSVKQQFILNTALDRFVQVAGPPPGYMWRNPGATGTDAMFVGLLFPVEDFRVYGYITTTKIKIIIVVEDDEMISLNEQQSVDDRIKALMAKIHKHYIEYTLNPFSNIDGPIKSKKFDKRIEEDVDTFNRAFS